MSTPLAMLCQNVEEEDLEGLLDSDDWAAEQKFDGMRVLAKVSGSKVLLSNRNGQPFLQSISDAVVADLAALPSGFILDGEIVGGRQLKLFDILETPMGDVRMRPFEERKRLLEAVVMQWQPRDIELVPTVYTAFGCHFMLDQITEQGGEGIILKHKNSYYEPGIRSYSWRKKKLWKTVDCIVAAVSPTGKRSISVGLLHDGEDPWPGEIFGTTKAGTVFVNAGNVMVRGRVLDVIKPGDIIEVKYLYLGEGEKLYSPAFLRFRPDKEMVECQTSQLKRVNKQILLPPSSAFSKN